MYYMKLVVSSCLLLSLAAHLLKMALVLVQSLYELERTLCTYSHTMLLKNATHFITSLRGGGLTSGSSSEFNLLNVPSSQPDLLLYHPYNLSFSTFK